MNLSLKPSPKSLLEPRNRNCIEEADKCPSFFWIYGQKKIIAPGSMAGVFQGYVFADRHTGGLGHWLATGRTLRNLRALRSRAHVVAVSAVELNDPVLREVLEANDAPRIKDVELGEELLCILGNRVPKLSFHSRAFAERPIVVV